MWEVLGRGKREDVGSVRTWEQGQCQYNTSIVDRLKTPSGMRGVSQD